ncbi:MAG: ATP-dependent Clp protease proteolytic subunit [Spirochaetes bacterium GWF1_31_7]|nr:MAG: ATP-dependent Clp protease proteolytic subunit [Spirochaetes bacterium GWE1_32_154]OHD48210.1 MAG: ATP-dependent Clp protease proteolytic subunit [Spirochaetes bacterium GWE2_31_10]OHD50628.1 MAG: ATP-dependent Clp protease proteolytic subunit [Spirochaetes bacterium GWF1_31_7]
MDSFYEKKFLEQRKIIISSQVDSKLTERVLKALFLLDALDPVKPITVIINSPGGEVFSGFAIYDIMKAINAPIITLVTGFAASMGSIIMLGSKKGKRYATKNAKVLIHQPLISGMFQGRATEIEIQAKEIQETRDKIINLYVEETGQSREKIAKDIELDYWMTAEQALEYKLIDKIITKMDEVI